MPDGPKKRPATRAPHDVVEYRASHNDVSSKEIERLARAAVVQKDFATAEIHYKSLIDVLSGEYDRLHL